MKKYMYLIIPILLVLLSVYIYGYHITKSEEIAYSYGSGILVQNKKIINPKINLRIDGTIDKKLIFGKKMEIFKILEGKLNVDQKVYNLNLGITRDNVYFGNAFENKNGAKVFTVFLSNDLKTIYLINDEEKYEIISTNTIEKFNDIKKVFLK